LLDLHFAFTKFHVVLTHHRKFGHQVANAEFHDRIFLSGHRQTALGIEFELAKPLSETTIASH
jgi:hypothetical protein